MRKEFAQKSTHSSTEDNLREISISASEFSIRERKFAGVRFFLYLCLFKILLWYVIKPTITYLLPVCYSVLRRLAIFFWLFALRVFVLITIRD